MEEHSKDCLPYPQILTWHLVPTRSLLGKDRQCIEKPCTGAEGLPVQGLFGKEPAVALGVILADSQATGSVSGMSFAAKHQARARPTGTRSQKIACVSRQLPQITLLTCAGPGTGGTYPKFAQTGTCYLPVVPASSPA